MRYRRTHEFIQDQLSPKLLRALAGGRKSPWPITKGSTQPYIFLIGSGRSGTTLTRTILNQHPEICIPPESHGALANVVKDYYRKAPQAWSQLVELVEHEFTRHKNLSYWGLDIKTWRKQALATKPGERSLRKLVDLFYEQYRDRVKPQAKLLGDKTPFNTLRLKWIKRLYPKAYYVYLLRDPRAVAASFKSSGLNTNVEENILRWRNSLEAWKKLTSKGKHKVLLLRYEDLIQYPTEKTKALCEFLNLEFDPEMVDRREGFSGDGQVAHHQNTQQKVNNQSLEKWRTILSAEELSAVEEALAVEMQEWAYPLSKDVS